MRVPILNAVQSSQDSLPSSLATINRQSLLDPWGNPYVYARLAAANGAPSVTGRTDKFGSPVNSGFDLYSLGKDGTSAQSFSASAGQDDVALGRDGGFIGLAQAFYPLAPQFGDRRRQAPLPSVQVHAEG